MKVIFVAGVHGVGKGTIAKQLAKKYQLPTYSAADLIASEKKAKVDIHKVVQEPNENQHFLSLAVSKLTSTDGRILLDGHFCLHNNENGIFKVPLSTFTSIGLAAVFLITTDPLVIYERLMKRDGAAMDLNVIENLQKAECLQAKIITASLSIPLIFSAKGDIQELEQYLNKHLSL